MQQQWEGLATTGVQIEFIIILFLKTRKQYVRKDHLFTLKFLAPKIRPYGLQLQNQGYQKKVTKIPGGLMNKKSFLPFAVLHHPKSGLTCVYTVTLLFIYNVNNKRILYIYNVISNLGQQLVGIYFIHHVRPYIMYITLVDDTLRNGYDDFFSHYCI